MSCIVRRLYCVRFYCLSFYVILILTAVIFVLPFGVTKNINNNDTLNNNIAMIDINSADLEILAADRTT